MSQHYADIMEAAMKEAARSIPADQVAVAAARATTRIVDSAVYLPCRSSALDGAAQIIRAHKYKPPVLSSLSHTR